MTTLADKLVEAGARAIYDALEGPVANQDFARQQRQWLLSLDLSRVALLAVVGSLLSDLKRGAS